MKLKTSINGRHSLFVQMTTVFYRFLEFDSLSYVTKKTPKRRHSWYANSRSAGKEIPRNLCSRKVHNSHPTDANLGHTNPVHTVQLLSLNTYFNITLLHTHMPYKFFTYIYNIPQEQCTHISRPGACYITTPSHPWFDHPMITWSGV